jgi:hypothetical protein
MARYRVWFEETRAFSYVVEADDRIEARLVAKEFLENNEDIDEEQVNFPEITEIERIG